MIPAHWALGTSQSVRKGLRLGKSLPVVTSTIAFFLPSVARADGVDALGSVALGVFVVWCLLALPTMGVAWFSRLETTGARALTSAMLCLIWVPASLVAFGAESPLLGLLLAAAVAAGLARAWRS